MPRLSPASPERNGRCVGGASGCCRVETALAAPWSWPSLGGPADLPWCVCDVAAALTEAKRLRLPHGAVLARCGLAVRGPRPSHARALARYGRWGERHAWVRGP